MDKEASNLGEGQTDEGTTKLPSDSGAKCPSLGQAGLLDGENRAGQKVCQAKQGQRARDGTLILPPDGGWGWIVTFGGFINLMLSPLVGTCFSIIFLHFLLDLGTSSTVTIWIYNFQCFVFNIVGLLAGPLIEEFGARRVTLVGALLTSISLILSAFATSAEFLFFSFSIIAGLGSGATVCITLLIVPKYFVDKRGRANSIIMAGFCIGQMVCPILSEYLVDTFGFRIGAFLAGSILLNGCAGSLLYHPVEWHSRKGRIAEDIEDDAKRTPTGREPDDNDVTEREAMLASSHRQSKNSSRPLISSTGDSASVTVTLPKHPKIQMKSGLRTHLESSVSSAGDSVSDTVNLPKHPQVQMKSGEVSHLDGNKYSSFVLLNTFRKVVKGTAENMRIMKSPQALIIAVSNTIYINGYFNFILLVPFAMQDAGHSLESSAWCISVSGICNLITRIAVNALTDYSWFNVKVVYKIGLATVAICTFVFPVVNDIYWLMAVMGLWGCGIGATVGIYTLIMTEVLGPAKMPACFGATCLFIGVGYITVAPIMGYVRDLTSSYAVSMWVSGGFVTVSFVLWLFMPCASVYDKRKEEEI